MEKALINTLQEMISTDGVDGIVVSDKHGLCLGAKGVGTEVSSGMWSSLLKEASKLEPDLPAPTVVLESKNRQCIVQGNEKLVLAMYKQRS